MKLRVEKLEMTMDKNVGTSCDSEESCSSELRKREAGFSVNLTHLKLPIQGTCVRNFTSMFQTNLLKLRIELVGCRKSMENSVEAKSETVGRGREATSLYACDRECSAQCLSWDFTPSFQCEVS